MTARTHDDGSSTGTRWCVRRRASSGEHRTTRAGTPLGTDFIIAEAFAETVTDRPDVAVLPTVPIGVGEHHRQFHGTLWVSPETSEDYVTESLASIASHGVRKAVIVNGHGGSGDALARAARRLRSEGTAFAPTWNWWESIPELSDELFENASAELNSVIDWVTEQSFESLLPEPHQ